MRRADGVRARALSLPRRRDEPGAEHRRDIDGLRAVAVTSVVVYHLGFRVAGHRLTGGFVGVDVFFVISGFLITGLIGQRLEAGTFTLVDFYRRRLRRILPALLAMLAVTSVGAAVLMFHADFVAYCSSLLATGLFSSNIYFWQQSGYFATPAASQPLLHTWSLGVEEQFYLLWPLLLLLLAKLAPHRTTIVLWLVTGASFAANLLLVSRAPSFVFYLLPTRAWELGLGGLLAVGAFPGVRSRIAGHAVGLLGIALVAVAVVGLHGSDSYPGVRALVPVAGAVLVLWAGEGSVVGKALGWRPFVVVGLISYSWYLWHWPLLALYRVHALERPGNTAALLLGAVSLVLAFLSYRLVETPLRRIALPRGRQVAGFAVASVAAVTAIGLALPPVVEAVAPEDARVRALLAVSSGPQAKIGRAGTCFISSADTASDYRETTCLTPDPVKRNVLLLGDSHAGDLYSALAAAAPDVNIMQATASGCFPLLPLAGTSRCTGVLGLAFDRLATLDVDTVVVSARWQTSTARSRLPRTLATLRQHSRQVVVMGPGQEYTAPLPELLARGIEDGDGDLASQHLIAGRFATDTAVRAIAERAGATYVSPLEALCPDRRCQEYARAAVPMLFDTNHYTLDGAGVVVKPLLAILRR